MTLAFTSGLDRPQETLIAEALVKRLGLLGGRDGFLKFVGEAAGLPSRLTDDPAWDRMLERMRGQAPAALVIIDSSRATPGGMTKRRRLWVREFDVAVAVFSNHRRDTIDGRLNPDVVSAGNRRADPGIRAMCELIDTLLLGWPLGIDGVLEMEPASRGTQAVFVGGGGTLRGMHYRVRAERRREAWPDIDTYLAAIRTTYQLSGERGTLTGETGLL